MFGNGPLLPSTGIVLSFLLELGFGVESDSYLVDMGSVLGTCHQC